MKCVETVIRNCLGNKTKAILTELLTEQIHYFISCILPQTFVNFSLIKYLTLLAEIFIASRISFCLNIRCTFNKLPEYFCTGISNCRRHLKSEYAITIVLWHDWPIFMISGSNQQLQQELEYTLLKPDCHCWWISKMQSGREDTLEEWYAIKLF